MVPYSAAPMLKVSLTFFSSRVMQDNKNLAQIFHVQELVQVVAGADHGEAVPGGSPIVEQRENTQAFRPNEGLGADDGHAHAAIAEFFADLFSLHLGLAVRADAVPPGRSRTMGDGRARRKTAVEEM